MNRDDLDLLRNALGKEPPAYAVASLEDTCKRTGLDWKLRHCYLMERGGKWRVECSIDGFRAVANSDENYNGQAGPFWTMGPDEPWTDVPPDKEPYASKVGVYRKGQEQPTWGVAKFKDYAAGPMWKKFPSTMIAKCAEMLGLRKALPAKLGGLYGAEEMAQADKGAAAVKTPAITAPPSSFEGEAPDDFATYKAKLSNAKTREEFSAIGAEIQKSGIGMEVKLQLSSHYKRVKTEKGWE